MSLLPKKKSACFPLEAATKLSYNCLLLNTVPVEGKWYYKAYPHKSFYKYKKYNLFKNLNKAINLPIRQRIFLRQFLNEKPKFLKRKTIKNQFQNNFTLCLNVSCNILINSLPKLIHSVLLFLHISTITSINTLFKEIVI